MNDTSSPCSSAVDVDALAARFRARNARVAVIGLGYVGLPLAHAATRCGFHTLGVDIDRAKVDLLNAGGSYITHITAESVAAIRVTGRFEATADFARLRDCEAIILCVPTPLTRQREPDLSFVERTTEEVAQHLQLG